MGGLLAILLIAAGAMLALKSHKPKPQPAAAGEASVAINVVPAGATVYVNGQPEGAAATGPFTIRRPPGTYDLEIRRAGYQSMTQKLEIREGATPITLALVPELPTLRIVGTGQVVVDSDPPAEIKDGQFEHQLMAGDHTIHVTMSRSSQTSFKVHVEQDGLPVISELKAQELTPLIVSNFGERGKIYDVNPMPIAVQLNGQPIGNLGPDGLDLPALTANTYELTMGDGKKRTIDAGPGRSVTVQLEADPNEGQLLVQTNEDNAEVTVLFNGKETSRKATQNKQASFPHLRAHGYIVQVSKDGYDTEAPKAVTITKGQPATVSFELRLKPMPGAILARSVPGAQIFLDGRPGDSVGNDGSVLIPSVPAGQHKIEARLRKYVAASAQVTLAANETKSVDLALKRSPGTVQISKDPPDATITYRKVGDAAEQQTAETSLSLPEGEYEMSAKAPSYGTRTARIQVKSEENTAVEFRLAPATKGSLAVTPIMDAWPKGEWALPELLRGWYMHRGEAFTGITRSGPAIIGFDALLTESGGLVRSHKLIWATNYRGPQDYLRYELTEKNLSIKTIGSKKENRPPKVVPKNLSYYRILLEWRSDSIAVKVDDKTIDEIKGSPGEFSEGKFGFLGNKEVQIQNFHIEAVN
jgi:hypothetical protein